ncbi:gamma-glutamyltransferase [Dehalococcoidia bacterium]|nr:gamma-glutamyltransferase [Dehalococcoidia bacterium]
MNYRSIWRPNRDEVVAENGVVTAMHPLAAKAGIEMLKQGGNAIDAAVATGFAICVVEPNNTSIAGVGFMLCHLASGVGEFPPGTNLVIEYGPRAPKSAQNDMFKITGPGAGISTYSVKDNENEQGYRSIALPGTAMGLYSAHALLGKLPIKQIMEPAIHLAQEGFEVDWLLSLMIGSSMDGLQRYPASREIFLPTGFPPKYLPDPSSTDQIVEKLIQKDLAEVLKQLARHGPAGIYKGEIAAYIEEDMRDNGGLITRKDLADYCATITKPLTHRFREYELTAPTAPCGSWTALEILNILENFDLRTMGHNSVEYLHTFLESSRHAFADRYRYLGDPDFTNIPLNGLLSKEYGAQLASTITPNRSDIESLSDKPPWDYFESKELHNPWIFDSSVEDVVQHESSGNQALDCTTHFGTADSEGNVVSCTQTAVSTFGSKVVTKDLGFVWNNGMVWFNPKAGTANSIAPWKRPLVNMAPLLALSKRVNGPVLSVGSPGGRQVTSANLNVVLNILEFGMSPQEGITASRTDAAGPVNLVDSRLDTSIVKSLREMGHAIRVVTDIESWYSFARPSAILVDKKRGILRAGTHALQTAQVLGY